MNFESFFILYISFFNQYIYVNISIVLQLFSCFIWFK